MRNFKSQFNLSPKVWGPGILFASTAIGVSHLVQSTRAGAGYGYTLLWAIVLANFFKYPFFEFGSRYAQATQTSLLVGYKKLGNWALWLYFIISVGSMFTVTAAVSFVTAAIIGTLTGLNSETAFMWQTIGLFAFCVLILALGKYKWLDKTIKLVAAFMLLSLIAVMVLLIIEPTQHLSAPNVLPIWQDHAQLLFVIALMGWMPTAVDLSAWNSIWTVERMKETAFRPSLKQTLSEFRFGYLTSAITALFFLVLGAELMFYSGETFPDAPVGFTNTLIALFSQKIGSWSFVLISMAALAVMFSTTITVFDGYSRAMRETSLLLGLPQLLHKYGVWLGLTAFGGLLLALFFVDHLKPLVDLATTISFLVAPVVGYINYKLVNSAHLNSESRPGAWLNRWALAGLLFLIAFAALFAYSVLLA